MASTKTEPRSWTVAEIEALFYEAHAERNRANREATSGPFNPFGNSGDSLVWCGSIEELWDDTSRRNELIESINRRREDAVAVGEEYDEIDPDEIDANNSDEQFGGLRSEIESALLDSRETIGTGRPIFYATQEGFPTVFRERATQDEVRKAVASFYDWSED